MNYSIEERVFMVQSFYSGNSLRRVRDLFSVKFNHRPIPSKSTINNCIRKFKETGSVTTKSRGGNKRYFDNTLEEMVLGMITADPMSSTRTIAENCNVTSTAVWKILHKHNYHPYKLQCHQEIFDVDLESRITFCEEMQERANQDRNFLNSICFTDECTFTLNNEANTQNTRYWSQENPRINLATRTQYPQKINIWAGIYNNKIIGPFEIVGNLNSQTYLDLLINEVGPALEEVAHEDQEVWYQHDGCPAHFGVNVRAHLNETFPNCWIGRGGTINWAARSPDLALCDFFLWPYLKNKIYRQRHPNINSLREAIIVECRHITERQLANVTTGFYHRLGYCLNQNGGLFEHLL